MDAREAPVWTAPQAHQDERERLQTLVVELLKTNEELRHQVSTLEQSLAAAQATHLLLLA